MSYQILPPHGGYRKLLSYQLATIAFDLGLEFANKYIGTRSRTHDQIVQALRSGKQNIVEASMASGTSKKTEITLLGVARASLEEALLEPAANCLICLIHQANFLLDRQIQAVEREFLEKGGLSERLYKARQGVRNAA